MHNSSVDPDIFVISFSEEYKVKMCIESSQVESMRDADGGERGGGGRVELHFANDISGGASSPGWTKRLFCCPCVFLFFCRPVGQSVGRPVGTAVPSR